MFFCFSSCIYLQLYPSTGRKETAVISVCHNTYCQVPLGWGSHFLILRKRNCHSERFNMCYAIIKITRIKIDEATAQVSRAVCVGGESIYLFSLCCLFNSNRFSTVQLTRCILLTQYKENDPNSILHRQRICLHFTKGDEKVDYDLNKCHSQPTLLPFFRFSLYRINT